MERRGLNFSGAQSDRHDLVQGRLCALAGHHVPSLPRRQGEVLALQALGFEDIELAKLLAIDVSTVQNQAYAARRKVVPDDFCGSTGRRYLFSSTRWNASTWLWLHRDCCAATLLRTLGLTLKPVAERLKLLEQSPARALTNEQLIILAFSAAGLDDSEIAEASGVSLATAKRREAEIRLLLHPGECEPSRMLITALAWTHGSCCQLLPREFTEASSRQPVDQHLQTGSRRLPATLSAMLRKGRIAVVVTILSAGAPIAAAFGSRRQRQAADRGSIARMFDEKPPEPGNRV